MFHYCLDIYFIFVFCAHIELSCSVDQKISTIEIESSIFEEICDSGEVCSCYYMPIDYSNNCSISMSCNDYRELVDLGLAPGFPPATMLPGCNIKVIFFMDDISLGEPILIEKFNVYESDIQIIPDFLFAKDTIQVLAINGSRLTSLEGKRLQNLKLVKKLFFCKNYIDMIDPDVFKGTDNVEYLDLSYNLLTTIPPKLLNPMKKLYYFSVAHNNLLHVDQLFSVTHPKIIRLCFNNLTNGDGILHYDDLEVQRRLFDAMYDPDKYQFELVDLSYNLIKITPKSFCLRNNRFPRLIGKLICKIRDLRLSGNELQNLTSLGYEKVQKLDVSRNKIQYLAAGDFRTIKDPVSLELQDNQIQWIGSGTFSPVKSSLSYLDLSSNNITSINGSIRYLSKLEFLNLAYNSIQVFDTDEFIDVPELTELYLGHNQIKSFEVLQQLNQLRFLDVRHNDIKSIRPHNVPKNLRTMNLAGNPFKCDCYIQPFLDEVKKNNLLTTDRDVCLLSDLGNGLQIEADCPDVCSCRCIEYDHVSFIFADCSSRNLSVLPQFFRHNLTQIKDNETISSDKWHSLTVRQNIDSSLNIEDRVLGISLENNNFKSRDLSRLPPNLTLLYLAGNQMRYLPDSIFDHQLILKQMSLSRNPWHCDCKTLKFKKWLTSRVKIIPDIDSIRCRTSDSNGKNLTGKVLWKLSDLDLCPTTDWALVVPYGVSTFVTFCLVVYVVHTKHELSIKVFLYSHGFTFVKEEDTDYDKDYDAFISFAHEDDEFVIKEIINVIEDTVPNIRLCFSYRNFIPGEHIYNNITHAVQCSKKTVLVLSKEFLQSEWCLVEFKVAHTQCLMDKKHRIILIKYGDLKEKVDPAIDRYLKRTTYLTWGESNFWRKLLFVLPVNNRI